MLCKIFRHWEVKFQFLHNCIKILTEEPIKHLMEPSDTKKLIIRLGHTFLFQVTKFVVLRLYYGKDSLPDNYIQYFLINSLFNIKIVFIITNKSYWKYQCGMHNTRKPCIYSFIPLQGKPDWNYIILFYSLPLISLLK